MDNELNELRSLLRNGFDQIHKCKKLLAQYDENFSESVGLAFVRELETLSQLEEKIEQAQMSLFLNASLPQELAAEFEKLRHAVTLLMERSLLIETAQMREEIERMTEAPHVLERIRAEIAQTPVDRKRHVVLEFLGRWIAKNGTRPTTDAQWADFLADCREYARRHRPKEEPPPHLDETSRG